ncbi:MAG: acetyl-CoA C-acyltransferase [Bacteroidota bacterium]|jgi:acetyl-CoA C-acetyltransferase
MRDVVIVSAVRTPLGSFGGTLKSLSATQLGSVAIRGAIDRIGLDPVLVTDVIMGAVLQANLGQAPARQAAKFAGLPDSVRCTTVNKVCASGMKAVSMAVQHIQLGDAEVVVAGGMESMSNVPFYSEHLRWGNKYGHVSLVDGLAKDGLTDVYDGKAMGIAAELCASTCQISRNDQDAFAIESYQRSQKAWNDGSFESEIVPVSIPQRKGDPVLITKDEEPFQVKFDKIPQLSPAFTKDGTITAANASTMNDGAAALVLMSAEKARELGLTPLGYVKGYADAEQAPEWFTTTPSIAIPAALKKSKLESEQIDYWEINEAFSVVALENIKRLGLDATKVNVFGGAVSIGHPLGCSGARILVTLLNVLEKKKARYGAAGICNGGGGASALVIERAAE